MYRLSSHVVLALAFLATPVFADGSFALLTPDEIVQWQSAKEATRGISLTRKDGPNIKVNAPTASSLVSPVSFDVELLPRDGVAPDPDTLKIEYGLGPIWMDVTSRIRAHARMNGTHFKATGAELPVGKHRLRLSVGDAKGRLTVADIHLTISN